MTKFKFFSNINSLEELRKEYKRLLKLHHPDNGGTKEASQTINNEYEALFKILKDKHDNKSNNSTSDTAGNSKATDNKSTMYDFEADKALREVLQRIINFEGIEIEIIGSWIWVSGDTYKHKAELKETGFKWASQKKMWYFHNDNTYRKSSNKKLNIEDIRNYYGSQKVKAGYERKILEA